MEKTTKQVKAHLRRKKHGKRKCVKVRQYGRER